MGLAETQRVLARLYTDPALRERFYADPQRTGAELGLNAADIEEVMRLSARQIEIFAHSLISKRMGEVRRLLPLGQRALGEQFAALFRCHAAAYLPGGHKKHRDDALAFAGFVVQQRFEAIPPWAIEIVRFEAARLLAHDPNRRFLARRFRYALRPLIASLERGDPAPLIIPRATLVIWLRLGIRGRLRQVMVGLWGS